MQRFIAKRALQSLLAIWVMSLIVFTLVRVTGNPLDVMLPLEAGPEDYARVAKHWGLDQPLYIQYAIFLGKALQGDFGNSWKWHGHSAMGLVSERLPGTLRWCEVDAIMRLVRSSMLEVLDSEFVKLSRIKGLSEWKVVWKHCLRNAAIAPRTFFAIIAGVLMTGSVVTESVFSWPGTGLLVVDAVRARDFQVVQAVVIVFSGIFIFTNLMVDILYAYLDPRIRFH